MAGAPISSGALVETLSGGKLSVSGTIVNSGGTIFASGASSLVDIASGAVVSGGLVEIGSGTVHVESGGSANVAFLATASGGVLAIEDSANSAGAFAGRVSGFGGVNHANHHQFIDLVDVQFASGSIHLSYTASSGGSGTLFVSSGGTAVAQINMIGTYTSANFSARDDGNGHVEIFDPVVPNGGSAVTAPAQSFSQHGIALANIAFGAMTTLAYSENGAGTGGTLTVTDDRHAATIALLGNYMAGSFVTAADGHGGTLITEGQTEQPLVARPRA